MGHNHLLNLTLMRSRHQPGESIHLFEALRDSYRTKCSRKHDEIYSMLRIPFNGMRFVSAVDYEIELENVVREMTRAYICSSKSLDLICFQDKENTNPLKLPSWAPDWRLIGRHRFNNRMIKYLIGRDEHPKINIRDNYWTATSKSRCSDVTFFGDRRVVRVSGLEIGTVDLLSSAADCDSPASVLSGADLRQIDKPDLRPDPNELIHHFASTNANQGVSCQIYRLLHTALFNIMTIYKTRSPIDDECGQWWPIFDFSSKRLKEIMLHKPHVHAWLMQNQTFKVAGYSLLSWSQISKDDLASRSKRILIRAWNQEPFDLRSQQICDAVSRVLDDGLRLMTTNTGHIGWAHPRARKGDRVFLLQGCSMPVILRPARGKADSTFTVIRDAYVHGGMYGELWAGKEDNLQYLYLV